MNILEALNKQFAIPVLRETREDHLEGLSRAIANGGMNVLEITLMSDVAFNVIKKLSKENGLIIGAGTVTTLDEAKKAIDAGAKFLVSPGLPARAVEYAHSQSVPFYPGVLTPTEIITARDLGCELMKIFPVSSVGGASYIKSLRGPFPQLKWMATGGVSLDDVKTYMNAGTFCVGIGNQLTPNEMINAKNWKGLSDIARIYLETVEESRRR